MTSRKLEGIAMLSMYDDDESDEENDTNDAEENSDEQHADASMLDATAAVDSVNDDNATSVVYDEKFVRSEHNPSPATVPASDKRSGRATFVDYGHDEIDDVTISPEAEESEIGGDGRVFDAGYSRNKTPRETPRISELSPSDATNESVLESDGGNIAEDEKGVDPLDKFLPPLLKTKCSEELQRNIQMLLENKKAGNSFNEDVRKKKDYMNPDFLWHEVRDHDIDQIGSCFDKDVFDPHGFDKSDYYDEINADLKRERERINQEKKNRQNLEFVSTGRQSTTVGAAPKRNVHLSGITMAATRLSSLPPYTNAVPPDSRQNKKSKWDKIDETHATLLPSANVGGYSLGHKKRREEEQKRSSEKKLDRRS